MMTLLFVSKLLLFALIIMFATGLVLIYYYFPVPLLSYQQGEAEIMQGVVSNITNLRGGVFEIGIKQGIVLEKPQNPDDVIQFMGGSITSFVHTRNKSDVPTPGKKVEVSVTNRYYLFLGKSLNWSNDWKEYVGVVPPGAVACLN